MPSQMTLLGNTDERKKRVLDYIKSRKEEGATVTEMVGCLFMKRNEIIDHLNWLAYEDLIRGVSKKGTNRKKQIVYVAIIEKSNIEIKDPPPRPPGKKAKCPACNRTVWMTTTTKGSELICDPQARYVIFDPSANPDFGQVITGVEEESGKLCEGRVASKEEAYRLNHGQTIDFPWTVIRQSHLRYCHKLDELLKIIFENGGKTLVEWKAETGIVTVSTGERKTNDTE